MEFSIRPIMQKDAKEINDIRRMKGVIETTLGLPSERYARSEAFISGLGPNEHNFVAVTQDADGIEHVIGTAGLMVSGGARLRHTASIGMMVHADYQNAGVGSALMAAMLDVADNWLMLVRVELGVFTFNERAIHLYEKFGFVKEGVKRAAVISEGRYVDEMIMARVRV